VLERQPYRRTFQAYDPDKGDITLWRLLSGPAGMTLDSLSGVLDYTADNNGVGVDTVRIKAEDTSRAFDTLTFLLRVINTNDPPRLVITEGPLMSYGAVSVKYRLEDPDRLHGQDSALGFIIGLVRPAQAETLFITSNIDTVASNMVAEFYPVYDDTITLFGRVWDRDTFFTLDLQTTVRPDSQSPARSAVPPASWRMISLPSKSVDLPPSVNTGNVRLYQWSWSMSNYAELMPGTDKLRPGAGVWVLSDSDFALNVQDTDRLTSAKPCSLSLKAGWNMIASPYAYAVKLPAGAGDTLYYWTGNGYSPADMLEPWKSYFYYSRGGTLAFDGRPQVTDSAAKVLLSLPRRLFKSSNDWTINVSANGKFSSDKANSIGFYPLAKESDDLYDIHEPPLSPDGGVSLFFEPMADSATRLSRSLDAPAGVTHEWVMGVSAARDPQVEVAFNGIAGLPDPYAVYLGRENNFTDLRQNSSFKVKAAGTEYYTVIVTQDKDFLNKIVKDYDLGQNYPNPFNPMTSIRFAIPTRFETNGRPIPERPRVSLKIYDMRGRAVRTLVDGESAANMRYAVSWDGKNNQGMIAASGMYLYRIDIGGRYVKSRKMVLLK
jgi:LysM repeat protein